MKNCMFLDSPIGQITLVGDGEAILELTFGRRPNGATEQPDELLERCAGQLREYFAGQRTEFDLPLNPQGTEFQLRVWSALREIPFGQTAAYSQIAQRIGSPKACRAVGLANNRNPISIIIPCHRVLGKDGSLTGYGGGLPAKQFLLALEGGK